VRQDRPRPATFQFVHYSVLLRPARGGLTLRDAVGDAMEARSWKPRRRSSVSPTPVRELARTWSAATTMRNTRRFGALLDFGGRRARQSSSPRGAFPCWSSTPSST
jgi:hypothetical protein